MKLRFPALLLASLSLVACSGGGEPAVSEVPDPGHEPGDPDPNDNNAPTAAAGQDRVVPVGSEVELDGKTSSDPDGDALSFAWEIVSKPAGSDAALHDPESRTPRFFADKAGHYEITLSVSDGVATATDTVTIRANSEPIANAGANRASPFGAEVILDGSGSSDPDGDSLSYAWAFVSSPEGSAVALEDADTVTTSFTPDVIGQYVVELTVHDGYAQAKARVHVDVTMESGAATSVLYLSPAGDDANSGTKSEPLKTIGEALDRAEANPDIERFVLASGSYEEGFERDITQKIEIVGPAEGEDEAIIQGDNDVFTVRGEDAKLTLLRVRIESGEVAVRIYDDASLSFVKTTCEAKSCIYGGDLDEQLMAGAVQITGSKLSGSAKTSTGVSIDNGSLTITDSVVENFGTGISFSGDGLFMRGATVRGNEDNGLMGVYASGIVIEDSLFEKNTKGMYFYAGGKVTVRNTEINGRPAPGPDSTHGIALHATTGIDLDDVKIRAHITAGLLVASNGSHLVKVRNSLLDANGNGVVVQGAESKVDLGNQNEAGGNVISSVHISGRSRGYCIDDRRPAGSDGAGFIRLGGTKLRGELLPAGSYTSAHATYNCAVSPRRLCVENTGNTVVAY